MALAAPDHEPRHDSLRVAASQWLAASAVAEMLYGAVVTAAVLAVVSTHTESAGQLLAASAGALLVYWATHVYTRSLADAIAVPHRSWRRVIGVAAVEELSILRGGVPTLVVFGLATLFGASVLAATDVAIWATVVMLAGVGYLAGHVAGAGPGQTVLTTLAAGGFGVLVALLKAGLH